MGEYFKHVQSRTDKPKECISRYSKKKLDKD